MIPSYRAPLPATPSYLLCNFFTQVASFASRCNIYYSTATSVVIILDTAQKQRLFLLCRRPKKKSNFLSKKKQQLTPPTNQYNSRKTAGHLFPHFFFLAHPCCLILLPSELPCGVKYHLSTTYYMVYHETTYYLVYRDTKQSIILRTIIAWWYRHRLFSRLEKIGDNNRIVSLLSAALGSTLSPPQDNKQTLTGWKSTGIWLAYRQLTPSPCRA